MTEKQRAVLNFLIDHPDATWHEVGMACGFKDAKKPGTAAALAARAPSVQERLSELMDSDPDLRNEALLERLKEGLRASKKTYATHEGIITDEKTDPDMPTRQNYLKLAFGVKGGLVQKQEISGPGGAPLAPVDLSSLTKEQLLALIEATKEPAAPESPKPEEPK